MSEEKTVDLVVIGAGLIGLAIALEMEGRGARVMVVERGEAMRQASVAAAGMLAVNDPANPAELLPLARMSVAMYPAFLRRVEALSRLAVPFQTTTARQYAEDGVASSLAEWSVDPRQLAAAVMAAVRATSIDLVEQSQIAVVEDCSAGMQVRLTSGATYETKQMVYATGAWTPTVDTAGFGSAVPIVPRKGQMLRVRLPERLALLEVHRSERVYVVPRTAGPQAGTALIGATVEDAGFDVRVHGEDLKGLRAMAAEMLPELSSEIQAPMVEAWAGLRPATPDGLPVLGAVAERRFVASGHYRNGMLLAPATAAVMADLLMGAAPAIDLNAFFLERFRNGNLREDTAQDRRYSRKGE